MLFPSKSQKAYGSKSISVTNVENPQFSESIKEFQYFFNVVDFKNGYLKCRSNHNFHFGN